jgi:hypothetical protein
VDSWKTVHYAIHFLEWYPGLINGVHAGHFIFSEIMLSSLQVLAALTLVLCFPRPLSWLTHLLNEAPVFKRRAAFLTAIIIVIVIIQSGTFQTTPFIYFRF